jgi:hypothetical protein
MHGEIVKANHRASEWSYHLLSPRRAGLSERARLVCAYECWKSVWGKMLRELDGAELTFADDFARQDEIGALFHGDECVGLSGYRWLDLSLPFHRADSYFAPWTALVLDQIAARSPRVCVGSNLVVTSAGRERMAPIKVSEALLTLAVRRFKGSKAQVMLGTMRNDRAMNSHAYRFGARPLIRDVPFHNVLVDLVVFERDARVEIQLPPIEWVAPQFDNRGESHDEDPGHLRWATG